MTIDELFDELENKVRDTYIVTLKYKYEFEENYVVENQILEYDSVVDSYVWLNDWNEGQTDVEVLGYMLLGDVDTTKLLTCEDCISRIDLIAAMHLIMDDAKIGDNDEDYESLDDIKEQYIEIVKGMVSVKPEIKWIPVSEKLPNRGDTVIATFQSPVTGMPFVATTHIVREPKEVVKDSNIIAWMPIMKPYKEK